MHKCFRGSIIVRVALEFVVKKEPEQGGAMIFSESKMVAEIKKDDRGTRLVNPKDRLEWKLSNKVDGEYTPFSYSVRKSKSTPDTGGEEDDSAKDEVFVVHDQLFKHKGSFYMLANFPKGKLWTEHVRSPVRYISRLDGFPYPDLSKVDYQDRDLRDKTKRLRGVAVGEASGLGIEEGGHHVRLDSELDDVGLFVAAISYLIYASA
jgi:hypothetical protein